MPFPLVRLSVWMIVAALTLHLLPQLPPDYGDPVLILMALFLIVVNKRWSTELAVFLLLFVWALSAARGVVNQINALSARPVNAVVTLEQVQSNRKRIRVRMISADGVMVFPPISAWLMITDLSVHYCAGQRWQMRLKLRPVHARLNEGGFDAQRFAIANGTPLTGRIVSAILEEGRCSLRDRIISSNYENYRALPWQAFISALAFGERNEVTQEMNQLLRETGTAHLMAISGMHISLAAGTGWLVGRFLQIGFAAHRIGYRFPLIVSLLVALLYTWLSGCNPPSVRAMLALSIWSALRLSGQCCSNWQVWLMCIGLILFFDPLSMLSDSLWLSAIAVAGLLFWFQWFPLPRRFARKKRWMLLRLLHLQLGMFLLMIPVQVLIFHGFSLSALLANLWAVPVTTLLSVPIILCAMLFNVITPLSHLLWWSADRTLALVFAPLSALPAGWLDVQEIALPLSVLLWAGMIAWRFHWWRSSPITLLAVSLAVMHGRLHISQPEWRVDMLDVGHGLAVAISRHGETTLYDTGDRWENGDAARSHIIPWLKWRGLQVRHIILSHGHLDHIGGLESVQQAFPLARVHSNLAMQSHFPCHRGISWRWQGLTFTALWPEAGERQSGNNQSCVVMVSDGKWRLLLTGDIEHQAERLLIKTHRQALAADVIQVAHHGSGTSSLPPFLRAVGGDVALASAARYSAWRFPAEPVVRRYQQAGYQWYDTAMTGQISVLFLHDGWRVRGLREQIMPRWYHQWFGVPRDSR